MSKYKIGDMYAPKSILMAVCQMASEADPIRRMYDALRKNPMDFNSPRRISMVYEETGILYLEGIPVPIKFNDMKGLFNPVWVAPEPEVVQGVIHANKGEEVPRENSAVVLDKFFKTAHSVKKRTVSDVVHHLSAEVGEISECLVQPQRGGDIVEESVDAIVCALDVIYLKLSTTHGTTEIAQVINKLLDKKLDKWYSTCS